MSRYDHELDASGLACPLPLLKTKMTLNTMESGQVLRVVATDAGSQRDFQAFITQSPHAMLDSEAVDGQYIYIIRKG